MAVGAGIAAVADAAPPRAETSRTARRRTVCSRLRKGRIRRTVSSRCTHVDCEPRTIFNTLADDDACTDKIETKNGEPSDKHCPARQTDTDINPHTPGIGHVAASTVQECCEICRSAAWWQKGCRFSTLSRGEDKARYSRDIAEI